MPVPYESLNVRRNPFGEFSEAERTTLAVVEISSLCSFLQQPGTAVQFVGEKGFGKTTHLLAVRASFPDAAYVHIPEGERASVPAGNPVLVDEAQRLTWWQRRRLFPAQTPLVLGTHRDFTPALLRAGRKVRTIPVQQGTTVGRLHTLLNQRIEHVRRTGGPTPTVSMETTERLLRECGPNVRLILSRLYDCFENLQRIKPL